MYHLFAYPSYYPSGGFTDYVGAFNSVDDAVKAFKKGKATNSGYRFDGGEIVQIKDGQFVHTHDLLRKVVRESEMGHLKEEYSITAVQEKKE